MNEYDLCVISVFLLPVAIGLLVSELNRQGFFPSRKVKKKNRRA